MVAEQSGMAAFAHGQHAEGLGLRYGTALMAVRPFEAARSHTFDSRGPLAPKGFTSATLRHNGCPVELVSLHLDFASEGRRRREVDALVSTLSTVHHPLVIMGDFNSEWGEGRAIDRLARALKLSAYQPLDRSLLTFPRLGRRLDWILVSPELRFRSYHSPKLDQLSDHRPVVAELEWRGADDCR
jgi:endonuclease/exonuclease/phosphatase family metal-dependent hydrolase